MIWLYHSQAMGKNRKVWKHYYFQIELPYNWIILMLYNCKLNESSEQYIIVVKLIVIVDKIILIYWHIWYTAGSTEGSRWHSILVPLLPYLSWRMSRLEIFDVCQCKCCVGNMFVCWSQSSPWLPGSMTALHSETKSMPSTDCLLGCPYKYL